MRRPGRAKVVAVAHDDDGARQLRDHGDLRVDAVAGRNVQINARGGVVVPRRDHALAAARARGRRRPARSRGGRAASPEKSLSFVDWNFSPPPPDRVVRRTTPAYPYSPPVLKDLTSNPLGGPCARRRRRGPAGAAADEAAGFSAAGG